MGDPAPPAPEAIVEQYCAASREQAVLLQGATMEVDIAASVPKLKKQGRLHALRRITDLGRITYEALRFEGDNVIRKDVIGKYLSAEADAQQRDQSRSMAVTPENYKFKYKGLNSLDGRDVHVFQVSPRRKAEGLFKGEIWIDAATYLRVQESGRLVKNPSFWMKRVEFVRTYEIRDGVSAPRRVQSTSNVRLVGKVELTIDFSNFSVETPRHDVIAAGGQ